MHFIAIFKQINALGILQIEKNHLCMDKQKINYFQNNLRRIFRNKMYHIRYRNRINYSTNFLTRYLIRFFH